MSSPQPPFLQDGTFRLRSYPEHDTLVLELSGSAESSLEKALGDALRGVTPEAARLGASEVVVDIRQVSFLTSSCLKDFLKWLQSVQELPSGQRYRVRFRFDPEITWQRSSLPALKAFAEDLVTLEPPIER